MHINNRARWIENSTVTVPVIRLKSGLKESFFKRARTELKEKGYIDYFSRTRNQAPVYRMVRLSGEEVVVVAPSNVVDGAGAEAGACGLLTNQIEDEGMDHLKDQAVGALIKQKENKKRQYDYCKQRDGILSRKFRCRESIRKR